MFLVIRVNKGNLKIEINLLRICGIQVNLFKKGIILND